MKTSEQVKVLCVRTGITLAELARRINQTPQNFNAKLKRNTLSVEELTEIATVLNASFEQYFILPNGDKIQ
jgi:transcriptional regulator with XRE-family HTH domain